MLSFHSAIPPLPTSEFPSYRIFQTINVMAAILRAKVRRASGVPAPRRHYTYQREKPPRGHFDI